MQMDADDDDDEQPFFKPQPIQTEPLTPRTGPEDDGASTAAEEGLSSPELERSEGQGHAQEGSQESAGGHSEATTLSED